jgi:hypothetical protein
LNFEISVFRFSIKRKETMKIPYVIGHALEKEGYKLLLSS